MKSMIYCVALATLWCVATFTHAQEAKEKSRKPLAEAAEEDAEKDLNLLPSPLNLIRGNVRDLESTGHFTIADVELRTRGNGDEALVWTVRVNKPVTCRHTEALIRRYRDVRFYTTFEKSTLEVMSTVMHYSRRIELGSSNDLLLTRDDIFEMSITLKPTDRRRLISMDVDRVVFRRWKY